MASDGRTGNAFWVTLPATALPARGIGDDSLQAETHTTVPAAEAPRAVEPEVQLPERAARTIDANDLRPTVPRTRVLLVDDVPVNQFVTATLLRREGHMVDVVSNGRAAVDAVQRVPYDLVLMDIFMPEMGGLEATRIIRSLPEPASLTPIVALTGNVAEDAELKASGMDGMVGKPVSLPVLQDTVRSRVWSGRRHEPCSLGGPGAGVRTALHDPWAVLSYARIGELRANLPPETFVNLVEECLSDLDHRLPALRLAVASANTGTIIAHAHAMVGMAANHGMAALETRLRTILAAARNGDTLTLSGSVVTKVEADLAEAARTLREVSQSEDV
jgi:CheY-like chemotaxis protein